jgi:hypothetical protein
MGWLQLSAGHMLLRVQPLATAMKVSVQGGPFFLIQPAGLSAHAIRAIRSLRRMPMPLFLHCDAAG